MKKVAILGLLGIAFSGLSSAAYTSCLSSGAWTIASLQGIINTGGTPNGACEIGDKIYSGFTGALSGSGDSINFGGPSVTPVGPGTAFYTVNVNSGTYTIPGTVGNNANDNAFFQGFTFGYTITVDQTQVVAGFTSAITSVGPSLQDLGGKDNGSVTKNMSGGATCTASETDVGGTITPSFCTGISATSLTVSDVFAYTSPSLNPNGARTINSIGNGFTETFTPSSATPEPVSMLLFGTGLLACGIIGRKRMVRK